MAPIHEVEAQRELWRRERQRERLDDLSTEDFAYDVDWSPRRDE